MKKLILLLIFLSVAGFAQKTNPIYYSVLAKKLGAEFTEWYGSASLLETPELHTKLQKKTI